MEYVYLRVNNMVRNNHMILHIWTFVSQWQPRCSKTKETVAVVAKLIFIGVGQSLVESRPDPKMVQIFQTKMAICENYQI